MNLTLNDLRCVMLGHAIGDAMGVPVEFRDRRELEQDPVTGYRSFGTHRVPAGTWSDDTSMALATLDSLTGGLDYGHILSRFQAWNNDNAYTATGVVFDMGITVFNALDRYGQHIDPLKCGLAGERDNGNGSLMRIHPAVFYCLSQLPDEAQRMQVLHNISALTHRHPRSRMACGLYACVLEALLEDRSKASVARGLQKARLFYEAQPEYQGELSSYSRLYDPDFSRLPVEEIRSSGYVVDTLEAALWCLLTTDSYRDCVLKAVNLGLDTDTVAAIAGGLAGALYGMEGIPGDWYEGLLRKEDIETLCAAFAEKYLKD